MCRILEFDTDETKAVSMGLARAPNRQRESALWPDKLARVTASPDRSRMGACRASCVDDSDFLFRARRAENCAPYLFSRLAL
jgi:hypothetical protein